MSSYSSSRVLLELYPGGRENSVNNKRLWYSKNKISSFTSCRSCENNSFRESSELIKESYKRTSIASLKYISFRKFLFPNIASINIRTEHDNR
jgi:hypothetical protein